MRMMIAIVISVSLLLIVSPEALAYTLSVQYVTQISVTIGSSVGGLSALVASGDSNYFNLTETPIGSDTPTFWLPALRDNKSYDYGVSRSAICAGQNWQCVNDVPQVNDGNHSIVWTTTDGATFAVGYAKGGQAEIDFIKEFQVKGGTITGVELVTVARFNSTISGLFNATLYNPVSGYECSNATYSSIIPGGPFELYRGIIATTCGTGVWTVEQLVQLEARYDVYQGSTYPVTFTSSTLYVSVESLPKWHSEVRFTIYSGDGVPYAANWTCNTTSTATIIQIWSVPFATWRTLSGVGSGCAVNAPQASVNKLLSDIDVLWDTWVLADHTVLYRAYTDFQHSAPAGITVFDRFYQWANTTEVVTVPFSGFTVGDVFIYLFFAGGAILVAYAIYRWNKER